MKILYIAPLPPPVNGQSLAASVYLQQLLKNHEVNVVNLRKESLIHGIDSFKRIMEIVKIFYSVLKNKKNVDVVYFTISESFAGNLKDLIILLLCYNLIHRTYIHLHGGTLKKEIFDKYKILFLINKFVLGKIAGAIVCGPSHIKIFENILPSKNIHIAKNFAEDYLFISNKQIIEKFSNTEPIRIFYISSMTSNKGYNHLADAYLKLHDSIKSKYCIDFAGAFDTEENKQIFLDKIKFESQIRYHGVVTGKYKKSLFKKAHIFCLPTSFLEGQPISILEAYATGCAVITTGQPGINDIFTNGQNGFEISETTADGIALLLEKMVGLTDELLCIAVNNRNLADNQFRTSNFTSRLNEIIETNVSIIHNN